MATAPAWPDLAWPGLAQPGWPGQPSLQPVGMGCMGWTSALSAGRSRQAGGGIHDCGILCRRFRAAISAGIFSRYSKTENTIVSDV
jgi:hypothetical protein